MRGARWSCMAIFFSLAGMYPASAAPLRLTLEDVVARAKAASLDLQTSQKDIDLANAHLERSRALLPSNPYFTGGAQRSDNFGPNYTFYLSQEFEIAGQRQKRIGAATENVQKATWEMQTAEQSLVAVAKTAFIHALVTVDRVNVAQRGVDAAHDLVEQLTSRKSSADLARIELNTAIMQESRSRRELATAMQTHDGSLDALRRLLGLPLHQDIELSGTPVTDVQEIPSGTELVERALRQRPDLTALRHNVQQADLQVAVAQRERIPNITLSGTVSRFEGDTLAGGDVSVPVPIFQRKTAELHEALAERDRASLQVQNLERTIEKEVVDSRNTCVVAAGDLQEQKRLIVPKSEENDQLEGRLYDRGEVTVADLINTHIDLLTARREYLDALETYNNALIELERIVGGSIAGP